MKVTLLIPTRNEIDGVRAVMPQIRREWIDEIVVVDGGSTDGTYEFFQHYDCTLVRQQSKGLCGAYWEGIEASTGDVIIAFSPDNNSKPEGIPQLVEAMRAGCDLVIASRYKDGARSEDDDAVTAFGNRLFTGLINFLFRTHYTDTLVMYRAFRKELMQSLPMTVKNHPIFELEMLLRATKKGLKIAEIPCDEPPRIGGVRKMSPLYNGTCVLLIILKEFLIR